MSSTQTNNLIRRRSSVPHASMFLRLLVRAAVLRRGRALSALLAMVVAAAVATALLTLYVDVQTKLRSEFRRYGANIVIVAKDGAALPEDTLRRVESTLDGQGVAVPFAYVVARTPDGRPVVVAGANFDQVRKLDSWWSVSQWPQAPGDALVGTRASATVGPQGRPFTLTFAGRSIQLRPTGKLRTGAAEDSRVYISLEDFQRWTAVQPSTIEIAASGTTAEVGEMVRKLGDAIPGVDVRPVRQILEGEARVLGKTRSTLLVSAILIIVTAALCVLSTLIGWVLDRRHDFAVMKALGASERLISGFFAAEAAALGIVGAAVGFLVGIGVAAWIGQVNFHAPVEPRLSVLPMILAGSIVVALISAIVPILLLRRLQPAMILRGE